MITAVIPARGGSKGLPNKNKKKFNGKPLVCYSIEQALESKLLSKIIVSSDDNDIVKISSNYEIDIDLRPKRLSGDHSKTIDLLYYISNKYPEIEYFVLLQPTSPLRTKDFIDFCLRKFIKSDFTNLASGFYTEIIEYGTHINKRRQDLKKYFYDDGNIYILTKDLIQKKLWCGKNPCLIENKKPYSFEIDTIDDFILLEKLQPNYKSAE
jgi:N-acylneuraminate cytidylyltransferase